MNATAPASPGGATWTLKPGAALAACMAVYVPCVGLLALAGRFVPFAGAVLGAIIGSEVGLALARRLAVHVLRPRAREGEGRVRARLGGVVLVERGAYRQLAADPGEDGAIFRRSPRVGGVGAGPSTIPLPYGAESVEQAMHLPGFHYLFALVVFVVAGGVTQSVQQSSMIAGLVVPIRAVIAMRAAWLAARGSLLAPGRLDVAFGHRVEAADVRGVNGEREGIELRLTEGDRVLLRPIAGQGDPLARAVLARVLLDPMAEPAEVHASDAPSAEGKSRLPSTASKE